MIRDIAKNLWYSYISRKMWETENTDCFGNRVGYSFIDSPEFRFRVMPLFLVSWAALGFMACGLAGISRLFFAVAIMFVPSGICLVVDCLIEKGKPKALYYAKEKLSKVQKKQSEEHEKEKDIKESCCFLAQRIRNIHINNVQFLFFKGGPNNEKDLLAVGPVGDGENVMKSACNVDERKGVQESAVAAVKSGGAGQVCDNASKIDDSFSETAKRVETPALKNTFGTRKERFSNNNCCACNFENSKSSFILLAKCYLSGWFIKDNEGNSMSKFMDDGRQRNRKECTQKKIYDFLGVLQDDHLWSEYNRFDRILLFFTAPLWMPMALINGGFRAANPYGNEKWLNSLFEEIYFFFFMSGVCALITWFFTF